MHDHNTGVQENRLWPVQIFSESSSKNPVVYVSGDKSALGELVDFQGSPLPSSRIVAYNEQKMKQKWQEACMDKKGAPDKAQM